MSTMRLREAALAMRREWRVHDSAEFCQCEDSDHWFDRSICPEPCGSMHDVCVECTLIKGYCAVRVEARQNSNRLAGAWLAVANLLDHTADVQDESLAQRGMSIAIGRMEAALAVADAYLCTQEPLGSPSGGG